MWCVSPWHTQRCSLAYLLHFKNVRCEDFLRETCQWVMHFPHINNGVEERSALHPHRPNHMKEAGECFRDPPGELYLCLLEIRWHRLLYLAPTWKKCKHEILILRADWEKRTLVELLPTNDGTKVYIFWGRNMDSFKGTLNKKPTWKDAGTPTEGSWGAWSTGSQRLRRKVYVND